MGLAIFCMLHAVGWHDNMDRWSIHSTPGTQSHGGVREIDSHFMASSSFYLRRRSRSSASDFLHHLRALYQSQSQSRPPARQFHLLVNPKLLSPLSRSGSSSSSANSFALTRTLTHSPWLDRLGADSATQSGVLNFGGSGGPIEEMISMLDWFHQLSGLPWWLVIASSTLAMRIALLPIIIVERKKLKRIGELLPKLPPPPWSPCLSGKSYIDQLLWILVMF